MNQLDYLIVADRMGCHLLDFAVTENEFATYFVFELYRPALLDALATYTSFKEWAKLKDVLRLDQRAVTEELDACLNQAAEINMTMDVYDVAAYIQVNEYAQYCFKRLVAYVDLFQDKLDGGLDEDI